MLFIFLSIVLLKVSSPKFSVLSFPKKWALVLYVYQNVTFGSHHLLIALYFTCCLCRGQPPDYVLKEAKNTSKFFKCIGSIQDAESGEVSASSKSAYQALTEEEYETVSIDVGPSQ